MHHNKFSAPTNNASSDNLNSGHPASVSGGNPDDPPQQSQHGALSREASLKKGSDGKHFSNFQIII